MYATLVRRLLRRSIGRLNAGDYRPMLATYGEDAVDVFPGDSSWGGEYRGRTAIEGFLRRFVAAGLQLEPREIVVGGPPWNTRICVLFRDFARDGDGNLVYENEGVIYAKVAFGKIRYQETFEDTSRVGAFDAYLAEHRPELMPNAAAAQGA